MRNPNRRLKALWEKDYLDSQNPRNERPGLAPEIQEKALYVRCLLLIPKNLVYVFILVICFAFAGMSFITYSDYDLKDFVSYGVKEREIFFVHDMFKVLQNTLTLDTGAVPEEPASIDHRRFNVEYLRQHRPCKVHGYASEWPATKKWPNLEYLAETAGFTNSGVFVLNIGQDGIPSTYTFNPRRKTVSLTEALREISQNDATRRGEEVALDDHQIRKERNFISYMDDVAMSPLLRPDVTLPLLQQFLNYQGFGLSLWERFNRIPQYSQNDRMVCALDGVEEYRLISPAYRQNLYSGVYDDLHPTALPEDITFFEIDKDKYPLMEEIKDHIQEATLEKGDCLYIPSLYWVQSRTVTTEAMLLTFTYETANKYANLLFTAMEDGILDQD